MKLFNAIVPIILICVSSYAQEFNIQVSSDTILAGNVLNVTFTADNVAGQFEGPDLKGMNVISGPNTSTSMTMINGEVTQTASYSYMILTDEIGEYTILPAYLETGSETLETLPISILVLPNPEGIIEQPPAQSRFFEFGFPQSQPKKKLPSKSKKKKRKLKRI